MRSIASVLSTLTQEEHYLNKSYGCKPITRYSYYGHRRLTQIRKQKELLSVSIEKLKTEQTNIYDACMESTKEAQDNYGTYTSLAISSLISGYFINKTVYFIVNDIMLPGLPFSLSIMIPFITWMHVHQYQYPIRKYRQQFNAYTTLIECRERNEAPNDSILNKLSSD